MSLTSYQLFCTIAETKNLTRAAELLHITPSAASYAISNMEQSLGFDILNRGRSGVSLTENGKLLLQHYQAVLAADTRLQEEISQINGLQKGVVHMGVIDGFCRIYLPDILSSFTAKYPQIEVCIHQDYGKSIESMVIGGVIEIGIVALPTSNQLSVITLFHDKMVCITPEDYAPENPPYISVNDLQSQVLIQATRGFDENLSAFFKANNLAPSPQHSIALETSAIAMVEANMGCSILPEATIKNRPGKYKIYSLENNLHRSIGIITQKNRRLSLAGSRMIKEIREFVK